MFKILKYDTDYTVDVIYNTAHNCDSYGCDSICRCGRIYNARIEKINASVDNFTFKKEKEFKNKKDLSNIDRYVLNRLMVIHGVYDDSNYDVDIRGGYYGEEFCGCTFENHAALVEDAEHVLNLQSDIEKIKFVLQKEYAYIAPMIEHTTSVEIVNLNLSEITPSSGMVMLKRQNDYLYDFEAVDTFYGIVYKSIIVDGNHRFSNLCNKHGTESDLVFPYIQLS